MLLLGVIWNSVQYKRDEIIKDINDKASILHMEVINLGDYFEKFIYELYNYPKEELWKIEKKVKGLTETSSCREICILIINLKRSKKVYCESKNMYMYQSIKNLKDSIRQKHKYIFDNTCHEFRELYKNDVFHIADDVTESRYQLRIINKYRKKL